MTLKAKKIVEFEIKIMHFKSIKLKNVSLKSFSTIGRNFFRWHCPFNTNYAPCNAKEHFRKIDFIRA